MTDLFIGEHPRLEAEMLENKNAPCAVITHPHPQMGGNMHNNVVLAARDAAFAHGFTTMRFNFRGTGRSGGCYDNGLGEIQDLKTALAHAGQSAFIIGYSFGSWVAANLLAEQNMPAILISPPTGMFEFPDLQAPNIWAVTGSRDQFCNTEILNDIIFPDHLTVSEGVDHFWFGMEDTLEKALTPILNQIGSLPG